MRIAALLLAIPVLFAGCTSGTDRPATDFATLAQNAPALLMADEAPTGTLSNETGNMTMDMSMQTQGHSMRMHMAMDIGKEHFADGAFLATMAMHDLQLDGKPSGVTLQVTFFCSATRIVIKGGAGMEALNHDMTNPAGSCAPDGSFLNSTPQKLDAQTTAILQTILDQAKVPTLKFERAEAQDGLDIAVYQAPLAFGMTGIDMHLALEARALLTGPRISHMDFNGTGDLSAPSGGPAGGQAMTAHIDMQGSIGYAYGTRASVPAEFA